jgi:HK97 family phage major capsid protein
MDAPERLSQLTRTQLNHIRSCDFARVVHSLHATNGATVDALKYFAMRFPRSLSLDVIEKAASTAGTTETPAWAGVFAQPGMAAIATPFVELLRPATVIGRIANLRRVPFATPVVIQTGGSTAAWAGQGAPKPVSQAAFATVRLDPTKAADIVVVTRELIALSAPGSAEVLRDDLVRAITQFLDEQFVDPAIAATADHPASITNGITPLAPSGTSGADLLADLKTLIATFSAANSTQYLTLLMHPNDVGVLNGAANLWNAPVTIAGGSVLGYPVVVSASVGRRIIALDASAIAVADQGGIDIAMSQSATLAMDSAPAAPTAATVLMSLWQNNLVGLRAERYINWQRTRTAAVQFLAPTAYV